MSTRQYASPVANLIGAIGLKTGENRLRDRRAACGLILLNRALHLRHRGWVDVRHSMSLFGVLSHFLQQFIFRRGLGFEVAILTNVFACKTERHDRLLLG